MSRKAKVIIGAVAILFAIVLAILIPLSLSENGERRALALDPTTTVVVLPTATALLQSTEISVFPTLTPVPTATPVLVPIGTALAQPTETAVTSTTVPVTKPVSSPTPSSTPLPLVSVTMSDILGKDESHLPIGYSGPEKNLETEKPSGLEDSPEPKGVGYYGIVDIGLTGKLAIMVDLDSAIVGTISESPKEPGMLYVGRELNGSLENAYAYPFIFNGAASEVNMYSVDFEEEGVIETTMRVSANIRRELLRVEGVPASQWKLSPVHAVAFTTYTVSTRVGNIPGTSESFVLQDRTGQGRFDDLETLAVQQDRNADGVFTGEPDPQLAQDAFLISTDGRWKVYSVSPSGRTVQLISESNARLAGLVRK